MKRLAPIAMTVSIAGICCVVAATVSAFYYSLYRYRDTKLEERVNYLERRLEWLEVHKPSHVVPFRATGALSTTDRPEAASSLPRGNQGTNTAYRVFQPQVKSGPLLGPEFRLPANITNKQEFEIVVDDDFGNVIDAWVSNVEPCQDLAAFDEFRVYCPARSTNLVHLIVQPKPGASVRTTFTVVLLRQYQGQ